MASIDDLMRRLDEIARMMANKVSGTSGLDPEHQEAVAEGLASSIMEKLVRASGTGPLFARKEQENKSKYIIISAEKAISTLSSVAPDRVREEVRKLVSKFNISKEASKQIKEDARELDRQEKIYKANFNKYKNIRTKIVDYDASSMRTIGKLVDRQIKIAGEIGVVTHRMRAGGLSAAQRRAAGARLTRLREMERVARDEERHQRGVYAKNRRRMSRAMGKAYAAAMSAQASGAVAARNLKKNAISGIKGASLNAANRLGRMGGFARGAWNTTKGTWNSMRANGSNSGSAALGAGATLAASAVAGMAFGGEAGLAVGIAVKGMIAALQKVNHELDKLRGESRALTKTFGMFSSGGMKSLIMMTRNDLMYNRYISANTQKFMEVSTNSDIAAKNTWKKWEVLTQSLTHVIGSVASSISGVFGSIGGKIAESVAPFLNPLLKKFGFPQIQFNNQVGAQPFEQAMMQAAGMGAPAPWQFNAQGIGVRGARRGGAAAIPRNPIPQPGGAGIPQRVQPAPPQAPPPNQAPGLPNGGVGVGANADELNKRLRRVDDRINFLEGMKGVGGLRGNEAQELRQLQAHRDLLRRQITAIGGVPVVMMPLNAQPVQNPHNVDVIRPMPRFV